MGCGGQGNLLPPISIIAPQILRARELTKGRHEQTALIRADRSEIGGLDSDEEQFENQ